MSIDIIGNRKNAVDKSKVFEALLTELSKTFDCLEHKLLIAKLHAYRLSLPALKLSHNYLTNRNREQIYIIPIANSWNLFLGNLNGPF